MRKTLEKYWGHDPAAIDAVLAGAPADVDGLADHDRLRWEERMLAALFAIPYPFDEATARGTMSYSSQRGGRGRSPEVLRRMADRYAKHYQVRTGAPYEALYAQELAGALLAMEDDGLPLPMPMPRLLVRDRQRRQP